MELELNEIEERVLGCLIEKEMATPEHYPLTLNALISACNQKSNRKPVMALDSATVEQALTTLRIHHSLALEVDTHGSRVPKFRHNMATHWNFSPAEQALLCELFIRGPQTPGDLRAHASRLHPLADAHEVDEILQRLGAHEQGPFVRHLPREPGKRERRWAHLFAGEPDLAAEQQETYVPPNNHDPDRMQALEHEIAKLREELDDLRLAFESFKQNFD